ncbi:hypothetical protein NADFUDRAFT_8577, partial [Nadsonia fulvescens var. elongata DSM 6958]
FRFQINNTDFYMSEPTILDKSTINITNPPTNFTSVPIIRLFGRADDGLSVMAHIHGVYPYLFIEYKGSLIPDDVDRGIAYLFRAINEALTIAYKRNPEGSASKFVANIILCKATPFYGFHVGWSYYLKIYMLNPSHINKLSDLLRNGNVTGTPIQPYEAHIPYLLQFFADFNLFGCGWMNLSKAYFRQPLPTDDQGTANFNWHGETSSFSLSEYDIHSIASPDLLLDSDAFPKNSFVPLEIDVLAQFIENRHQIEPRSLHHNFIERDHPISPDTKFVNSVKELWDEDRARRQQIDPCSAYSPPATFDDVDLIRDYSTAKWLSEDEMRFQLRQAANESKRAYQGILPQFEHFIHPKPYNGLVKSVLNVVDAMFTEVTDQLFRNDRQGTVNIEKSQNIYDVLGLNAETVNRKAGSSEQNDQNCERSEGDTICVKDILGSKMCIYEIQMDIDDAFESPVLTPQTLRDREGNNDIDKNELTFDQTELKDGFNDIIKGTQEIDQNKPVRGRMSPPFLKSILKNSPAVKGILNISTPAPVINANQKNPNTPTKISSFQMPVSSANRSISFNDTPQYLPLSSKWQNMSTPLNKRNISFSEMSFETSLSRIQKRRIPYISTSSSVPETPEASLINAISTEFDITLPSIILRAGKKPPSIQEIVSTLGVLGLEETHYQEPFYSEKSDISSRPLAFAGVEHHVLGNSVPYLEPFIFEAGISNTIDNKFGLIDKAGAHSDTSKFIWQYIEIPPSYEEVIQWLKSANTEAEVASKKPSWKSLLSSQIDVKFTPNKYGFKYASQRKRRFVNRKGLKPLLMTALGIEIHVNTRGHKQPDPKYDAIACIFWKEYVGNQSQERASGDNTSDPEDILEDMDSTPVQEGIILLSSDYERTKRLKSLVNWDVQVERSENDMIIALIDLVRDLDPDILTGFEIHGSSWGYIIDRGKTHFEFEMCNELSRIDGNSRHKINDRWGFTHASAIHITGRHFINTWRVLRSELNLLQYTIENVVYHVLHVRIPKYSHHTLSEWYRNGNNTQITAFFQYYIDRVKYNMLLIEHQEIITRTCEYARLIGIDFYSVLSRGSQYKVESIMIRIAKAENFILVSPSRKQVAQQNALECLPLVMEPTSKFYSSPMLVLDFQSLYPSCVIAYNYCYSTCLGRVQGWKGTSKMGFTNLDLPPGLLDLLKEDINISPNGIMFVKPNVRKSLLSKMLKELLDTRVMIKSAMKIDKSDIGYQKLQHNRQLSLKLIANVTYGYTSATFSGRMPCSDIADAIVQTGRETLERAINIIQKNEYWNAEVVYGDTDSLFVYLPGRTKDEAFRIGQEISDTVTKNNPPPIKLKFEKVYLPCVLLAKKRYVGYSYENPNEKVPLFDAKGIETVRRDGTPAQQKILEQVLRILFNTTDLSKIKSYLYSQWLKIIKGKVSIQDFCFAKEVKLGSYKTGGTLPPGAHISAKKLANDERDMPQYRERVPYVIVTGSPGQRLVDRAVPPEELMRNPQLRLDAEYYIIKNLIPPLERVLNILGASAKQWYKDMPRIIRYQSTRANNRSLFTDTTLSGFVKSGTCRICQNEKACETKVEGVGHDCLLPINLPRSVYTLQSRIKEREKEFAELNIICRNCSGFPPGTRTIDCVSGECPTFYSRVKSYAKLDNCYNTDLKIVKDL